MSHETLLGFLGEIDEIKKREFAPNPFIAQLEDRTFRFAGVGMQFGKIHGVALAVLGAILLGVQAMLYMAPQKVVSCSTESSIPKVEHKTNPVAGILGIVSLIAGVAIFARGGEPTNPRRNTPLSSGHTTTGEIPPTRKGKEIATNQTVSCSGPAAARREP